MFRADCGLVDLHVQQAVFSLISIAINTMTKTSWGERVYFYFIALYKFIIKGSQGRSLRQKKPWRNAAILATPRLKFTAFISLLYGYVHTYTFLNITCLVCIMLHVCFQGWPFGPGQPFLSQANLPRDGITDNGLISLHQLAIKKMPPQTCH